MIVTVKGNKLIIEMDMEANPAPSKSGKTVVVASSHGNAPTTAQYNGKPIVVGVNAYVRA